MTNRIATLSMMSVPNMYYEFGSLDASPMVTFKASPVAVAKPAQYVDKWPFDRTGVRPIANTEVKNILGFN